MSVKYSCTGGEASLAAHQQKDELHRDQAGRRTQVTPQPTPPIHPGPSAHITPSDGGKVEFHPDAAGRKTCTVNLHCIPISVGRAGGQGQVSRVFSAGLTTLTHCFTFPLNRRLFTYSPYVSQHIISTWLCCCYWRMFQFSGLS